MDNVETKPASWLLLLLLLIGSLIPLGGCRICADCEDLAYPAYGGAWQRTRREGGRVGSIFDPGGAKASELVSRDTPPDSDELQRKREEERGGKEIDPDDLDDRGMSDEEREQRFRDKEKIEDELRERKLDDIEQEKEDELRKKDLDDINVRIIPGQPIPPILQ